LAAAVVAQAQAVAAAQVAFYITLQLFCLLEL
jgi:hypothetical protein